MPITVSLTQAIAMTNSVSISLASASYVLKANYGVMVSGTFPFKTMAITEDAVNFGVAPGTRFNGTVVLNAQPASQGGAPVLVSAT
jgi:hypothetical protein